MTRAAKSSVNDRFHLEGVDPSSFVVCKRVLHSDMMDSDDMPDMPTRFDARICSANLLQTAAGKHPVEEFRMPAPR